MFLILTVKRQILNEGKKKETRYNTRPWKLMHHFFWEEQKRSYVPPHLKKKYKVELPKTLRWRCSYD